MKKEKFWNMPYEERYAYKKGLVKKIRAYSITAVACTGLIFGTAAFSFIYAYNKSEDFTDFKNENGISYQSYVEKTQEQELDTLQEQVLAKEISFDDYEMARKNLSAPSEEDYLQTLDAETLQEYNHLEKKAQIAQSGALIATLASAMPAIACTVMLDKKDKEFKSL